MSGPEIAAEMARHITEFKRARRPTELTTTETWAAGTQSNVGQSQTAVHPFLRARLAAESAAALGRDSTSLCSQDGNLDHTEILVPSGARPGLAFLRHGARIERSGENNSQLSSRGRSSYYAGLLSGAALALTLVAVGSAALWRSGALPDLLEAGLQRVAAPERTADPVTSHQEVIKTSPVIAQQEPARRRLQSS